MAAGQAVNWALGDEAAKMVVTFGRKVIPDIATVARCSSERIRQLIRVSATFDTDKRYQDVDWSVYRSALHASKRLDKDPGEVLQQAVDQDLSLADIARMGKSSKNSITLAKTCTYCGTKTTIMADGNQAGEPVYCPLCVASNVVLNQTLTLEGIQQYRLGVLE